MAIQVMIKRIIHQGQQAEKVVPLILRLRALAIYQPGYISSETWCDIDHPGDCVVISKWETVEDWNRWKHGKERATIERKIEAIIKEPTEYRIFAPMVAREGYKDTTIK